jgi:hypothetical protein
MTEGLRQEEEVTPEGESAPFVASFDELPKEEQDAIDALLAGDMADMFSSEGDQEEVVTEHAERVASPEEAVMASHITALQEEADDIIAHTPEADRPKALEKINTVMRALIIGGMGLFGAANEASAQGFDLGQILRSEISGTLQETQQVRQQETQARFNAQNQLRQAQMNYNQSIRYINGQRAALDNPKLQELSQRQADAYWNSVYAQRIAWAKTPEQQQQVRAEVDAQRAQALAGQQMQKEQQKMNLENQIAQADINFENQKIQITESYKAEVERIKEQAKYNRQQQRYQYMPR